MFAKTKSKFIILLSLIFCLSFVLCALTACGGNGNNDKPGESDKPEKELSVTLTPTQAELLVGETVKLEVKTEYVEKAGITTKSEMTVRNMVRNPVFTSSDKSVATVSSSGLVTAIAKGTAVITATVEGKSATADITVLNGIEIDSANKIVDIYNADGLTSFNGSVNDDEVSYNDYKINLKRDIDLNGASWYPLNGYNLAGTVWNGNGHAVKNLKISSVINTVNITGPEISATGFIAASYKITMKNIVFDNVTVAPNNFEYYAGIVLGYLDGAGEFDNVTVKNSNITTVSRRGTGAIVGFNNDQYFIGEQLIKSTLVIKNSLVENVTIESNRSAALCGRVCNGYSVNEKAMDVHSVILVNNTVKNCTVKAVVDYTPGRLNFTVNDDIDTVITDFDATNVSVGNRYFFNNVEYNYSNGVFTVKSK